MAQGGFPAADRALCPSCTFARSVNVVAVGFRGECHEGLQLSHWKITTEEFPGMRAECSSYVSRGALGHQVPAVFSSLRAQVEDPVRAADHIQVVFDDDHGVAQVGQPV